MNKFEKRTVCEYCEGALEAKNRNKRFCSDKCRVYFGRENKKQPTKPQPLKSQSPTTENKGELTSFERLRNQRLGIKNN